MKNRQIPYTPQMPNNFWSIQKSGDKNTELWSNTTHSLSYILINLLIGRVNSIKKTQKMSS
jgi:hypothetical protein